MPPWILWMTTTFDISFLLSPPRWVTALFSSSKGKLTFCWWFWKSLAETLGTTNLFGTLGNNLPEDWLDPGVPEAAGLGKILLMSVVPLASAGVRRGWGCPSLLYFQRGLEDLFWRLFSCRFDVWGWCTVFEYSLDVLGF